MVESTPLVTLAHAFSVGRSDIAVRPADAPWTGDPFHSERWSQNTMPILALDDNDEDEKKDGEDGYWDDDFEDDEDDDLKDDGASADEDELDADDDLEDEEDDEEF